ncbi:hypothetical protein LCGC14_0373410 [marine sediment metagenome]|uniref:Uncharacterized protein n=1 Tax=marine sediment metagenome TaxID=412755 RepID=A0A0F9VRN8_9ZZZZ
MKADAVFGFARDEDVEQAIMARIEFVAEEETAEILKMLGEAVVALLEINSVIPVSAKHRHLVAQALEGFADGPR